MGNKVEDDAINWLIAQMPGAQDTRHVPGADGDLLWGERVIEVKAYGRDTARGAHVWLEWRQYRAAMRNPHFELWLVDKVLGGLSAMRLTVITGERLARALDRARPVQHVELPIPVAEFDAARRETDSAATSGHYPDPRSTR